MRRALMFAGAFWPPVYLVVFFVLIGVAAIRGGGDPDDDLLVPFGLLVGLHIATILIGLAATVAYVVEAWRSPRHPQDQRTLWVLVLLLGGMIAMPVYWWIYLRTAPEAESMAA